MALKKKIFLSILMVFIVLSQAGVSYWSFHFIQEGEFALGISLFLLVPVLALAVVYAYIVFIKGPNR